MKIIICDVCFQEGPKTEPRKIVESHFKIKYLHCTTGTVLSLDVCKHHKDFFKGVKTFEEAEKKVNKLFGI